jgi:hypothetical protein
MKIYNKIVIDIQNGETLFEDSFDYEGPLELAKGGGGSSSGIVDYPAYMKTVHEAMLGSTGTTHHICTLIDAAIATSPYSGETAYDPDSDITAMLTAIGDLDTAINTLDGFGDWATIVATVKGVVDSSIVDDTTIDATADAQAAMLADKLTTEVLPRFETGMRDINAVISSSFVIGKSVLEAFNTREVSDLAAKLRLQAYSQRNQMILTGAQNTLQHIANVIAYKDSLAKTWAEGYRIKTVFKKEEVGENLDIQAKDYVWGIDLFQYGANLLGSIAGSAINTMKPPSTTQSVIGGAMSGAGAGYQASGSWQGAAIGAIGGAILGGM